MVFFPRGRKSSGGREGTKGRREKGRLEGKMDGKREEKREKGRREEKGKGTGKGSEGLIFFPREWGSGRLDFRS